MKTAIVGLGVIGNVHYNVLKNMGNCAVAVCDVDSKKLSQFDGVEKYTDYVEMLDRVKPEVVHICTPHYLHEQMIISALERDINVLCEKPLCISREEIDRILIAEKKSKAQLGVCHQNRYNLENVFVKDYLKDAKILLESKIAKCTPSEQAFLRRYFDKADSKKRLIEAFDFSVVSEG